MENKQCKVCGSDAAFKNDKGDYLCAKHWLQWIVITVIVGASITGLIFLFT